MKLDQETAEAIIRLMGNRDFKTVLDYLDTVEAGFVTGAIHGDGEHGSPDLLRGRAQGIGIFKHEVSKAPDVAGRIHKVS